MSRRDNLKHEIRARADDPHEIAAQLGLEGVRSQSGGGVLCRCPVHDDRSASCSLTIGPDGSLRVRCFGCDLSGDVFSLVAAIEGRSSSSDFPEIMRRAGELVGVYVDDRPFEPRAPRPRPQASPPPSRVDLHPLVLPLATLGALDGRDVARVRQVESYLAGRGLLDVARAAGCFALPPDPRVIVDAFGSELVGRTGLLRSGRWAWGAHVLCVAWRGLDGRTTTLQRRHLDQAGLGDVPKYVVPRDHAALAPFGAEQLAGASADAPIAIVEGVLDALALRLLDAGSGRTVLGVQGVKGWHADWDALARGRVVHIAFDDDVPGDSAAIDLAPRLLAAGATAVRRARPVGAKDWAAIVAGRRTAA